MNLKPLHLLPLFLTFFFYLPLQAQCDGSFLETIIFECDAPFDMNERTTFGVISGTWSGGAYINSNGLFNPSGLVAGDYTITFTTSSPPCNPSTNFTVTVAESPQVDITQNTLFICSNTPSVDLTTFEAIGSMPGFWSGPGVSNNTTFNPSGLNGQVQLTFTAFCDIDLPASCTPPPIPNPVCGCDNVFYNSACAAELAGITSYTPWVFNFSASCPNDSGCEPDEATLTVTVIPAANITLTATNLDLCDEDALINLNDYVAASSDVGTWDSSDTFDPSAVGVGNYSFEYSTNVGSCDDMATLTISVEENFDLILTQASLIVCSTDGTVNLNDYVDAGSDAGTWNGTGVDSATGIFDIAAAGIDTHTLTYSSGFDTCDDLETFVIVVNETLNALLITDEIAICTNDSFIDLSQYVDLASDAGTWIGSGVTNGFFNPSVGSQTIFFTNPSGTCSNSTQFTITVNPLADAVLNTIAITACSADAPIDLSQYVDISSEAGEWSGTGVTTDFFDPSVGSQTVIFTTTTGSCEGSTDLIINVTPNPDVILTTTEIEACFSNGIIDLSQYIDVSSADGIWAGQGVTSFTSEFDVNAGSQTITFSAFNGDCEDTESLSIIVYPSPTANLTQNNLSVCSTDTDIDLSSFLTADTDSGDWSGTGVSGNTFDISAGSQIVTYTTNLGVCDESVTLDIAVISPPDVSTISPSNGQLCTNSGTDFIQTVDLTDLVAGDTGGAWSYSPIVGGANPISGTTFDANGLPEDTYTLVYSIDSGIPCGIASSSQTIEVITCQADCTANASLNPPSDLCGEANDVLNLNTLVTGDAGGTWSSSAPVGTLTGSSFNPENLSGSFTITYTVSDVEQDCPDAVQNANINISNPITANVETLCAPNNLTYVLTVTLSGGILPYLVNGSGIVGNVYTQTLNDDEAYSLIIDDAGNCDEIEVSGSLDCFCLPPVDPTAASNDLSYCEGTTVPTISAVANGVDSYNWYANETDTEPLGTGVDFVPSGAGTYWLEAVSPIGCPSLNRIPVIITEIPRPNPPQISPLSAFIVQNQYFIAEAIPGEGGEINWYNEADDLVHTGLSRQVFSETVGSFMLFITETVNGCESEPVIFNYTVNPFDIETCPNITSFNVPDTLHLCTGAEITLSFLNDDNNNLLRGEWVDLAGSVVSNDKNLVVSEIANGCAPVVVQYIARSYCVINPVEFFDSDTATVIFYPFPQSATFAASGDGCSVQVIPQSLCPNFSIYTDENVLVEGAFTLPTGTGTANFILANDDADDQGLFECAGTISYEYDCISTDCPTIDNVDAPLSACSGEEINLTATIDDPNNQLDRTEWILPDGSPIAGNILNFTEIFVGCDPVEFTFLFQVYCLQDPATVFDSRTIIVSIFPDYEVDLVTVFNEECAVPTLSTDCSSYTITAVDVPTTVEEGDSGLATWTISSPNNCFSEDISFPYNCPDPGCPTVEAPTAVSPTELTFCENEVNTQAFEAQVPPQTVVNWYDVAAGGVAILENSNTFTAINEGIYYAEAMTLPDECTSNDRLVFELIVNTLEDASFSYSSNTYCLTEDNPLPDAITTIGGLFSSPNGIDVNSTTGEINLSTLTLGASYTIEYQTTGDCPNSSSFTFNISEDNIEVDAGEPLVFCAGETILLNGQTLLGVPTAFEWSANIEGNFDNVNDLNTSFNLTEDINNFYLYLSASNNCGDDFVDSVEVTISEIEGLSFSGDTNLGLGETTELEVMGGNGVFVWTEHPDLSCTDCPNPIFTANTVGTNTLVVESDTTCVLPLTINITVNAPQSERPILTIPNAFSPNGDGVNDVFRAVSNTALDNFTLIIYNRWGDQVFQSNDINDAWDGSFKDEMQEIGTYVYVLQYQFVDDRPKLKRGNVTLVW